METIRFENLNKQSYTMKECLRALKTNIQFCGDDIKVIMITSSLPNEGKSTVAFELARSFTESSKSVLFIDTDMRKSVLAGKLRAKTLHSKEMGGLSHYLTGQKKMGEVLYATDVPGLFMIFGGPKVPNPTEILDKAYFTDLISFARDNFDYVIVDCPPLGAAIDAAVVAKHCDGAILVVGQGMVNSRLLTETKNQLEPSGVRILGAVMNKMQMKKNYGRYYGKYYGGYYGSYYGGYGKYYGEGEDEEG